MKTSKFLWGWTQNNLLPDTSMTRARAALLIRAWRKGGFGLQRIGNHHYQVTARGYEAEPATMIIVLD